jgi:hypothetical protein
MVEGQHHGLAGTGTEDAGQPILHAPVIGVRALQKKHLALLRYVRVKIFFFFREVRFCH